MTTGEPSATPEAVRLAERLRELREREYGKLTQTELGRALGGEVPASPATISMWESPTSGRTIPSSRIESYALLFCTPRSFDGAARLLALEDLTALEQGRFEELKQELFELRDRAVGRQDLAASRAARSMWHFPDGSRITLVCGRLPADLLPPHADVGNLDYVRLAQLADLDALIDIYGEVKTYNPASRVRILAAEDLAQRDVANHLVLIGGLAWTAVNPWFSRIFPMRTFPTPLDPADPGKRGAIVVRNSDGEEQEFRSTLLDGQLIEDVGVFARGANPSAPQRTLTICGGITTRGVHGAARCFIDKEMRQRNEQYLFPRFPDGSTYCIVMRVPVVNNGPLTPDLSRDDSRLFEWCDASESK